MGAMSIGVAWNLAAFWSIASESQSPFGDQTLVGIRSELRLSSPNKLLVRLRVDWSNTKERETSRKFKVIPTCWEKERMRFTINWTAAAATLLSVALFSSMALAAPPGAKAGPGARGGAGGPGGGAGGPGGGARGGPGAQGGPGVQARPNPQQMAMMLIQRFDKDGDKSLNARELSAALAAMQQQMRGVQGGPGGPAGQAQGGRGGPGAAGGRGGGGGRRGPAR